MPKRISFNDKKVFTIARGLTLISKVSAKRHRWRIVYYGIGLEIQKVDHAFISTTNKTSGYMYIEGEYRAKVGEEIFNLKPGDSLFMPRKVPHQFRKLSDGPGRMIVAYHQLEKWKPFSKS
jgi:mannose-6-phosphate isomerase-like protein (cupin superfamily)